MQLGNTAHTVAKGTFRLLLVLFAVSWIAAAIMIFLEIEKDRGRLDGQISPYLREDFAEFQPTELDWPVYAATPEFILLPLPERGMMAKTFYQEHIAMWEPIWDLAPLKEWIIVSSQYSTQEAPIRTINWDGSEVSYRAFRSPGIWNHPRLSYVVFDSNTLLIAGFFSIALASFSAIVFFTVRWVVRGFKRS